jgi:two-component system, chemotaxis family, CheB/CheR fusion protein
MPKEKTIRKPRKTSPAALRNQASPLSFPVVAIGASAGGLAAFNALLHALPPRSGMAFVLIQHLEPSHESALTSLLAKATGMPVVEVSDGMPVEPDHVYVIPPNRNMTIHAGLLLLAPRSEHSGPQHPIDDFSVALAEEQGSGSIGVVLSGTGSDGTYGLRAIKAAGGVTFAQDPKTAQWPTMPANAIAAGSVDFVLSTTRIAAELARIARHPYIAEAKEIPDGADLDKICLIVGNTVGVDFRQYKRPTVRRRIARRMALQKIASMSKYLQILKQNPDEAKALAEDIFIHVTSFFRDPDCFEALKKQVLAKLRVNASPGDPIRIWVPGCSTGEEVYSIAMLLMEELGDRGGRTGVQFFGTDIEQRAVDHARAGIYSESVVAAVSPARRKRFFTRTDGSYRIQKAIRDLCVFAKHNLAKDPPFSRLDLISCRNVLIYMSPVLQNRILSIFQYALKPGGVLFLGNSESIGEYSNAFSVDDLKHRIFQRKLTAPRFHEFRAGPEHYQELESTALKTSLPATVDYRREAEEVLLEHYSPSALIVDQNLHILHFQGDISPYLAPATGQPSFHLLKMLRPELVVDVRTAIQKVRKEGTTVRKDPVRFEHRGQRAAARIEVRPIRIGGNGRQDLMVVFQPLDIASQDESRNGRREAKLPGAADRRSAAKAEKLERELAATREHLRSLISDHEAANEEMKAANEEILSSNEELQSTNEELETAKEELQSSNEELITLNDELQHRNAELNVLMHDLGNLLVGIDIPVLLLDGDLRVRRFTPVAGQLLNLIPGDVGRPFSNIASSLQVPDWGELLSQVTGEGNSIEREVNDRHGHRYSLRLRPYKATDNKVEGVLVVMLDVDQIYRARDEAQRYGDYSRAIVETIREALAVVDAEFRLQTVNRSFCEMFRVILEEVEGRSLLEIGDGEWRVPRLRQLLEDILPKSTRIEDFEIDQTFPRVGRRHMVLNARRIETSKTILIAIEDFTERRRAQEEAEKSRLTIRALLESALQSIISVDPNGKIAMINGNTETMFGYRSEELIGRPLDLLIPEEGRERHPEHFKAYLASPRSRLAGNGLNLNGRKKDGTTFPVEIALSAIDTAEGKLAVAFVSDITQRVQLEQAAQARALEVQALAASLLTVQEDERRRVSRELHDRICQQLAALAIDIGTLAADPPPSGKTRDRLKALQTRVVKASEETRHIAYELHSSVLDDLGLAASLRDLCRQFSERAPETKVKYTDVPVSAPVPREIASCIYRVAHECLQNIAQHTHARRVSVALTLEKGVIVLTVVDDGAGFHPEAVKGRGGLGLIGMEERARLVKGQLTITSQPGKGARIALRIPMNSDVL